MPAATDSELMRLAPWLLAGALFYLGFGYTEMMGSDLWWHVAGGGEILRQGSVWLVDNWSYTEFGEPWRNHEWLADIIYHLWVSVSGLPSLVYWKWLLIIFTYGALQWLLYRETRDPLASLLAALLAIALAEPFLDIRPHLYTLAGLSVLLLLAYRRQPPLWQLLLLFVIWVNLHGGFIFGLMALGLLLFPWREFSLAGALRAVRVVALCALVCLLNPDGINVVLLPFTYAFDTDSPYRQLGEWLSPFAPGGIQAPLFIWALPLAGVVAAAYLVPALRKNADLSWSALALCALSLAMALVSRRFIPLFGISLALVSAPLLALCLRPAAAALPRALACVALLALALYRLLPYPLAAGPAFHYLTAEYQFPRDTLDVVALNGLEGKVFAYYNWGGYIHLRTAGGMQVYIDGRANTVYDDDTYNQYVQVLSGAPGWMDSVIDSGAEYFLWPKMLGGGQEKIQALWQSQQWKLVYQDSVSFLLARKGVTTPARLSLPRDTIARNLTLAQENLYGGDVARAMRYSRKVLREAPWERGACANLITALEQLGQATRAQETLADCRKQFPSRYLQ